MSLDEESQSAINTEEKITSAFDDVSAENLRFYGEDGEVGLVESGMNRDASSSSAYGQPHGDSFFLKLRNRRKVDENSEKTRSESTENKEKRMNCWDFIKRTPRNLIKQSPIWAHNKRLTPVLRGTLAVLLYSVLIWVQPTTQFLGLGGAIGSLSVILFDSSLTRGAAYQSVFLFAITLGIGCGASTLGVWSTWKVGYAFAILHLFFWSYCFAFARSKLSNRWTVPIMLTHLTFIATLLLGIRPGRELDFIFRTFFSVFCGAFISLIAILIIIPRSAASVLRKEMEFTCKTSLKLLDLTVNAFLQRASKEDINALAILEKNNKKHIASLTLKLEEFKWEFSYSRYSPKDIEKMINFMRLWVVQMRSMCSSCCIQKQLLKKDNNVKKVILLLTPILSEIKDVNHRILSGITEEFEGRKWSRFAQNLRNPPSENEEKKLNTDDLERSLHRLEEENDKIIKAIFHQNTEMPLQNWDDIFLLYFFVFNFGEFSVQIKKLASFVKENREHKRHLWAPVYWKSFWKREGREKDKGIPQPKIGIQESQPVFKMRERFHNYIQKLFGESSAQYGIKVAVAILLASILQFIPDTREWYTDWRGEWAPITITVVFGPSALGGNLVDFTLRIIGTAVGAVWAIISWLAFPGNAGGLFFMLVIISLPSFYIKMNNPYPKIGSVTLLTYTIIVFGKFFQKDNPAFFSIYELAYKRTIMTIIGILIIVCLDRILWPQLARVQLRIQIASLLTLSSSIYRKTVTILLTNENNPSLIKEIQREQTLASLKLVKAETLLKYAKIEPRLLGPLPVKYYKIITEDTSLLLDRTVSLRMAVSKGFSKEIRERVLLPLQEQRKVMVSHCLMLLWIASSSIRWKRKLPQYLPDARKAREKILIAIQKSPFFKDGSAIHNSSELLQYYAWLMATKEITTLLHEILDTMKQLFGEEANIPNFDWGENKTVEV
eukprot:TRINITY_DN4845_c0_g1_i1.p1 TRINITY_DN4845_c0_g1~~TRINITY_DN4845_c0_g1_i1.p1  ORF type:complete len:948 (-),score=244.71 TRINITY_DN4845_c0_g1_i1:91-2934(-)